MSDRMRRRQLAEASRPKRERVLPGASPVGARTRWLVSTVALIGALAAAGCRRPPPPPGSLAYTGSTACATCHPAQVATWQGSAHALAAQPAAAAQARAHFDGRRREMASTAFRPIAWGERLAIEIDATDPAPPRELDLVLGRLQIEQFLTRTVGGRWQVLPMGYDTVGRDWFDVFPEAPSARDWAHWTNPGANANSQCLECHTTGYDKGYDRAADTYATRWAELGVGCEACHGPGSRHVAERRAGTTPATPYGAARERPAMPGCVFCHSRRAVIANGYTPGAEPSDFFDFELLEGELYHADGTMRGEVYEWASFRMSVMAARGIGCGDCHEPHGAGLRLAGDALCLQCHEAPLATTAHTHHREGSAGSACVGCHMPVTVFMERDARRDHLIGRPDPEGAAAIGAPDACTTCHRDRDQAWAAEWVGRWYGPSPTLLARRGPARAIAGGRAGDGAAVEGLLALLGSPADDVRRASAARLLAPWTAHAGIVDALARASTDPAPLVRAAAVRSLGDAVPAHPRALTAVLHGARDPVRLVRAEAGFALRGVDLDALPATDRDVADTAFSTWLRAQEPLVDLPETNFNRGLFHAARGHGDEAEAAYRAAIRAWPWDLPPRHNLALLLADLGRRDDAQRELEALLDRQAGWPPAAFALALLHAEAEHWADAAAQLEACLTNDPAYPRARYNLALAYGHLGDHARAELALERAVTDPSARADALRELVRLAHHQNDRAKMERWLPEALRADPNARDDPRVAEALRQRGAADD